MFDFVETNKRIVQIVLFLIIITFGFFGIDSYRKYGSGDVPATVNGEKISQQEFTNAIRQQQERLREQAGANYDPSLFDKPAIKRMILDGLINQHLLSQQAKAAGLLLGDQQLAQMIAGIEAFRKDGKFDKQQYEEVLRSQNMTPAIFESRLQDELATRNLMDAYLRNGYGSAVAADNLMHMNEQQRTVSIAQISPDAFLKRVSVDDAAVKDYYDRNQSEFKVPERAKVEYLVLSASALQSQVSVSDAEIRKYYDEHLAEFSTPELRKAAHILIAVAHNASDAEKQAARVKAEQVLKEVKAEPSKFAELAKKYSQDPGSASNGGDLGMFGRGMMVKPFDDAVYKMLVGEVSDLVQTDFGYHIIKLLAVKGGKAQSFAEVKSTIAQKLKTQKANDKYAELAEKFSDTVYEQSDSLKPAADLIKMPVQTVAWLSKGQIGVAPWTDKAIQAVFSDEVIKNKRNTAAIEIAPNTLISARVVEYKPESTSPLAEVTSTIRQKLQSQKAQDLAVEEGKASLDKLQQGAGVVMEWKKPLTITRNQHPGLENDFVRQIFRSGSVKFPVYIGMQSEQGGYLLARIDSVKNVEKIDDQKRAVYQQQLRKLTGEELLQAYVEDAKSHASIKVAQSAGDAKTN